MAEENAHSSRFTRAEGSRGLKRILLQKDKLAVFCCFYCRCSFSFWLEIVAFSHRHSLLFCFAFSFCSFYSCCCCCVCQSLVAFVWRSQGSSLETRLGRCPCSIDKRVSLSFLVFFCLQDRSLAWSWTCVRLRTVFPLSLSLYHGHCCDLLTFCGQIRHGQ